MAPRSLADVIGVVNAQAYYNLISGIESAHNPKAKAKTSSASGRFQFIRSTWEGLGYKWSDVFNDTLQYQAIEKFTFANVRVMMAAGCAINFATLYGAHFLGVNGLLNIIDDRPSDPITKSTTPAQRKANPSILGETITAEINGFKRPRTVLDFCKWLEKKTGHSVYKNLVAAPIIPPVAEVKPIKRRTVMSWLTEILTK